MVGWNIHDTTRLVAGGLDCQSTRDGALMSSPTRSINYALKLFEGRTLLVWCGENRTSAQQQQLTSWQEQGHDIFPLGI
ncbi:MerR family transcriptional regulator [Escherichia coli]|uniref:MerR family transcriptional regulator n=1 Tax=Escherichia coli TaxID=562 RepID=A0A376S9N9_ECOLX|nr:MerR family transcriptional regulator [Escherichia coli]